MHSERRLRSAHLRKPLTLLALLLTLSASASCASTSDLSCVVFKPITFSDKDTPETVEQIIQFDSTWERLCLKE